MPVTRRRRRTPREKMRMHIHCLLDCGRKDTPSPSNKVTQQQANHRCHHQLRCTAAGSTVAQQKGFQAGQPRHDTLWVTTNGWNMFLTRKAQSIGRHACVTYHMRPVSLLTMCGINAGTSPVAKTAKNTVSFQSRQPWPPPLLCLCYLSFCKQCTCKCPLGTSQLAAEIKAPQHAATTTTYTHG
jgi:hypothetical protein